jgi:hypothetical protein
MATVAILTLLMGCATWRTTPYGHKCPVHNVEFLKGRGKLPEGLCVFWKPEMSAAMQKYPYVRHDIWESRKVKYCVSCEEAVDRVMETERNRSQQQRD